MELLVLVVSAIHPSITFQTFQGKDEKLFPIIFLT